MDTDWVNAWYVTAIDFATGELVWQKYVGSGKQWDHALLTISISPDGLLTWGMLTSVLAVRDVRSEDLPKSTPLSTVLE